MSEYSLIKNGLEATSKHLDMNRIAAETKQRRADTTEYGLTFYKIPSNQLLNKKLYSFDGSLIVDVEEFKETAPEFFRRSRRVIFYRNHAYLRGGRYLISSNPTFELRQKLLTFAEDIDEGIVAFQGCTNQLYQLGIADYIKSAAVTMLNALLYEEKTGKYRFDNISYQSLRNEAQEYGQAAVNFFYGVLLNDERLMNEAFIAIVTKRNVFNRIQEYVVRKYEDRVFSSRHITRPEASHPLIIASAVLQYCMATRGKDCRNTIVGLPSGSTELAFAHAIGQRLEKKLCDVLLFPISLHSAKSDFDDFNIKQDALARWSRHYSSYICNKDLLIVDDNTSTGRTIQHVVNSVRLEKPQSIDFAIAEADIVRTQIDLLDEGRKNIANSDLYKYSVNILPVSRVTAPKTDLKELFERMKMIACTKARYTSKYSTLSDIIVGEVYINMLNITTEKAISITPSSNIIRSFRKSFLSNFYKVEIIYDGKSFESVEHAYQAMKFKPDTWEKISQADVLFINKKLRNRGTTITLDNIKEIFVSSEVSAGTTKKTANCLRIRGYVRDDWDDVKPRIMAELLIQKFSKPEIWNMLKATTGMYLIEGNDWNDTYWGVCNGRGRNVLGRMLMAIRGKEFEVILNESERLLELNRPK